ncbi:hypothetical protein [Desulfogranum marinum]|nr:hypothetical protein [Desulfogranum marinum]
MPYDQTLKTVLQLWATIEERNNMLEINGVNIHEQLLEADNFTFYCGT